MPVTKNLIRYSLLAFACLSPFAWCQSPLAPTPTDSDEDRSRMQELVRRVARSNYDPTVGLQEMPFLEEAFEEAKDPLMKANLASVLVTLGKKDDAYWSVLAKSGQEAIDSQVPDPLVYDANGKSIRGEVSPRFADWAKNRGVTVSQAFEEADKFSGAILLIAETGDVRGRPILRQALSSPNCIMQAFAARGLGVLQDRDSIPRIIDAAKRAPRDAQSLIAEPLVVFNDATAQAAASELVPDKTTLDYLTQRVREKGPRGVF